LAYICNNLVTGLTFGILDAVFFIPETACLAPGISPALAKSIDAKSKTLPVLFTACFKAKPPTLLVTFKPKGKKPPIKAPSCAYKSLFLNLAIAKALPVLPSKLSRPLPVPKNLDSKGSIASLLPAIKSAVPRPKAPKPIAPASFVIFLGFFIFFGSGIFLIFL